MNFINTSINDLIIIKPKSHEDSRGYFFESFRMDLFNKNILDIKFVQENESLSKKGVLRGFHFQKPPHDQSKLVRCIRGKVLDVALDLRIGSKTYGKYESIILSEKNKLQFFIPKGFAHAFLVLSDEAVFSYKVDNYYMPSHDSGIIWNDPVLNVDWKSYLDSKFIISEKDNSLENFSNLDSPFKI